MQECGYSLEEVLNLRLLPSSASDSLTSCCLDVYFNAEKFVSLFAGEDSNASGEEAEQEGRGDCLKAAIPAALSAEEASAVFCSLKADSAGLVSLSQLLHGLLPANAPPEVQPLVERIQVAAACRTGS